MRGFLPPQSNAALAAPKDSATVRNEPKAIASLVFGMLSMTCAGLFTGIPAMLLGSMAHVSITESRGRRIGGKMATAGAMLGAVGTFVNVVFFAAVAAVALNARYAGDDSNSRVALTQSAAAQNGAHRSAENFGVLDVVTLGGSDARPLRTQIIDAQRRATEHHRVLLVVTHARWSPPAKKFRDALVDPRMQVALSKATIAFVDIDEFGPELGTFGIEMDSVPLFFKIDSRQRAIDAISAAEWDDETPGDMAPVLAQFLSGTYAKRREPAAVGTFL